MCRACLELSAHCHNTNTLMQFATKHGWTGENQEQSHAYLVNISHWSSYSLDSMLHLPNMRVIYFNNWYKASYDNPYFLIWLEKLFVYVEKHVLIIFYFVEKTILLIKDKCSGCICKMQKFIMLQCKNLKSSSAMFIVHINVNVHQSPSRYEALAQQ